MTRLHIQQGEVATTVTADAAQFLDGQTSPEDQLCLDMQNLILNYEAARPRSQQTAIGPSEVGQPCVRRLGYQLNETPRINRPDPWASITGTAVHAMLEQAAATDPDRWLTETRIQIDPTLGGNVDLYDRHHQRVIDHKCSGATGMKHYRAEGPKPQQIIQIHLYAFGMRQLGHEVREVALVFYPLGGLMTGRHGIHTWIAPYNEKIATDAIERLTDIRVLIAGLDTEHHPNRLGMLPAHTTPLCGWCPWFRDSSTDLATGCPGHTTP